MLIYVILHLLINNILKIIMKNIISFILKIDGQMMTEYIIVTVLVTLTMVVAMKLIPRAFTFAFNRIITFHSLHMDELSGIISSLLFKK